jgi:hypothetical protein
MQRYKLFTITSLIAVTTLACTQASVDGAGGSSGQKNTGGSGSGGSSSTGEGSNGSVIDFKVVDAGPRRSAVDGRPLRCDSQGQNCSCLAIASYGKIAHYGNQSGAGDNTDAFQSYMNEKSNAKMALFGSVVQSKKPFPLTADFLKNYDILILQALEDSEYNGFWTFGQDEIDALKDWVDKGGGVISMSGYGGNSEEVTPLNQLLSFAGISYNKDDIFNQCLDNTCYCRNSSLAFGGWNASDLPLTSNLDSSTRQVGVFMGRSINCSDCQIMATGMANGKTVNVGVHKQIGAGRVFSFADEWVTYTSQWNGDPVKMAAPDCAGQTADKLFNVPQFWYNVFRWVSGDSACFQIDDPTIIIQ